MEVLKPFRYKAAASILSAYGYDQPFHLFFTALCRQNKQWGSKDRKIYKTLCYQYFRSGYLYRHLPLEDGIAAAHALSESNAGEMPFDAMYPFRDQVSPEAGFDYWCRVLFTRKPMYLLMRSGSEDAVVNYLKQNNIPYTPVSASCLKLEADSKCDALNEQGRAWAMDAASQMAADMVVIRKGDAVWDACSGSGGKSLYLRNKYRFEFELTCSDLRFHTLENLKTRFHRTGLPVPAIELTDLSKGFQLSDTYQVIVLDVPCSGSGTWGRTPENITGFGPDKLHYYAGLQRQIFANTIRHLKPGGTLYYMTCSVFAAENEDNVQTFCRTFGLELKESRYCHTGDAESDVLYCAVLQKP